MAAWYAQLCAPKRLISMLLVAICIVAHSEAHRSLLQPSKEKGPKAKGKPENSEAPGPKFDNVDAVTGEPAPPSGKRAGFRTAGDAKAFLAMLGPDVTEQLAASANYFYESNTDAGLVALEQLLESGDDVVVDLDNMQLLFQCSAPALNATEEQLQAAAQWANSQPPEAISPDGTGLSSRPGAPYRLWLDFNGSTIANESTFWSKDYCGHWNPSKCVNGAIVTPRWDNDGNPSVYSASELSEITAMWQAVAEDFAPFNIDVTTTPPPSSAWPSTYLRVVIGGTGSWYDGVGNFGGVAYVNGWGRNSTYEQPVWVFSQNLGPKYPKYVWEAISHEAGHWFGLLHDGQHKDGSARDEYYWGNPGNGADWAPVMGTAYYAKISQWSKGDYPYPTQLQDDMGILTSKLGLAPTPLPTGETPATAVNLRVELETPQERSGSTKGTLNNGSSVHVYAIEASAGVATFTCDVTPNWVGWQRTNLNCEVTVKAPDGVTIRATINPLGYTTPVGLGTGNVNVTLATAGRYYLEVRGKGDGDPWANVSPGYPAYGSVGNYNLVARWPNPTPPPPPSPVPPTPLPSPSPSPSPSPRPSPSPAPQAPAILVTPTMANPSASLVKTTIPNTYTCRTTITLKLSNGKAAAGVSVIVEWASRFAVQGYSTQVRESGVTSSKGQVIVTMTGMPMAGKGCSASVTRTVTAGYVLSRTVTVLKTWS